MNRMLEDVRGRREELAGQLYKEAFSAWNLLWMVPALAGVGMGTHWVGNKIKSTFSPGPTSDWGKEQLAKIQPQLDALAQRYGAFTGADDVLDPVKGKAAYDLEAAKVFNSLKGFMDPRYKSLRDAFKTQQELAWQNKRPAAVKNVAQAQKDALEYQKALDERTQIWPKERDARLNPGTWRDKYTPEVVAMVDRMMQRLETLHATAGSDPKVMDRLFNTIQRFINPGK